jgi:2-polyprenyl-3-methyl-5-hydroxy-6-metoxy-1,4-benzoquinol methylase
VSGDSALEVNRQFYEGVSPGQQDYWNKMAAPLARRRVLLNLLSSFQPERAIDLGCGGGQLLQEIASNMPHMQLAGIDLSHTQIERNRQALPMIHWEAADLTGCDWDPGSLTARFDAVIASELIEHVESPLTLLHNARRLVRPGGRLFLSTQSGPLRATERSVGHVRHFTRSDMKAILQESGWKPISVWNSGFPFHDLSKWWANRNPHKTLRQFGDKPYGLYENLVCLVLRLLFRLNSNRLGAQLYAVAESKETLA